MFTNLKNLKLANVIIILFVLIKLNITKVLCDDQNMRDMCKHQQQTQFQQRQQLCKDDVPNAIETQKFQEFFIEHNVTKTDATQAFWESGVKLLDDKPLPTWCRMNPCTPNIMQYCLSGKMLQDHCCCDSRHGKEELPWIPHSCYVGDTCVPIIGSCISYTEYRQCCCDRALAKQWKKIYSTGSQITINYLMLIVLLSSVFLC